jgi:hypothetical protein
VRPRCFSTSAAACSLSGLHPPELPVQDRGGHAAVPLRVAAAAERGIGVEQHGHGRQPGLPGGLELGAPPRRVEAERVDHGGQAALQPGRDDLVKQGERVRRGVQVMLTAAGDAAKLVGGHDFLRPVPGPRPGRLSRAGRADQHDERGVRQCGAHAFFYTCRPRGRRPGGASMVVPEARK